MANPINPLLAIIFTFINSLGGKSVAKHRHRLDKRDPMIFPVQRGFGIVPFEFVVLHDYGIPV